jgi:UDP-N-acetylglucosamine kinase
MMDMTPEDRQINENAMVWARANKKAFAKAIADPAKYPAELCPASVFMAGSPGAGKTEVSKALVHNLGGNILRVDPDEFRIVIPGYSGANSWLFQGAISVLAGKVIDLALEQKQSLLLDGTFSHLGHATTNVERALHKSRDVLVIYVYQEPLQAWDFVQAREALEGRRIPADKFIEQLFGARDVLNALKVKFGNLVRIDVIYKDIDGKSRRYDANVNEVDSISGSREVIERLVSQRSNTAC